MALEPIPVRSLRVQTLSEVVVVGGVRVRATLLEQVGVVTDPVTVPTCLGRPLLTIDAPFPAVCDETVRTRVVGAKPTSVVRFLTASSRTTATIVPHAQRVEGAQAAVHASVATSERMST